MPLGSVLRPALPRRDLAKSDAGRRNKSLMCYHFCLRAQPRQHSPVRFWESGPSHTTSTTCSSVRFGNNHLPWLLRCLFPTGASTATERITVRVSCSNPAQPVQL